MKKTNQIGAFILSVLIMLQAFPASAPAEGTAEFHPPEKFYSVSFGEKTYLVAAGYTITEFPDPSGEEEGLFLGWYDGDTKVEPPYTPEGDVRLTPRFEETKPEDQRTLEFTAEDGSVISLTGLIPETCTLNVTEESGSAPVLLMAKRGGDGPDLSPVELYRYDISLKNPDGTEFQPDGNPVALTLRGPKFEEALGQGRSIHVTHIPDEGEAEEITDLSVRQDTVSFSVDHFSGFRFTGEYDLADWAEDISADDVRVSLSGVMPLGAEAEAVSASPELEEGKVLAAADISLLNKGVCVQPSSWQGELTVRLSSEAIAQAVRAGDEIAVFHVEADGTMTRLKDEDVKLTEEGAEFTADAFSVYVVAGYSMETTIEAGDGNTYKITLTFKADAVLPDGAVLKAEELTGEAAEDYLGRTAVFLNAGGFAYGRVFDISIVDQEGTKVQPEAPVEVTVELLDTAGAAGSFSVVHFTQESEESERAEAVEAETEGNTVSFVAESFSAYAIVTGPEAVPLGWEKLTSVSELATLGAQGVYIGHTSGFYMMDTTDGDSTRMGIKKTKPAASAPVDGAAQYFFEPVEGTDNQFYVYCVKNGARQYVYNGGNNSLSFTDQANRTAFTVSVSNGQFTLGHAGWYWNMQGGANGTRFCSWNTANDVNSKLYIWHYSEGGEDPYQLDGLSYGLMNWNGGVAGKAVMAEVSGSNLKGEALTVMNHRDNYQNRLYVSSDSDISMWTFEWAEGDRYYLKSGDQYLKIENSGLSLTSVRDDTCKIQIVPGTGIHSGEISLKANGATLTYSGDINAGFDVNHGSGLEYLYLVQLDELTSDYYRIYSAEEAGITEPESGAYVIIYCRVWDEELGQYRFYAIDENGGLVPCFESGNELQWVGSALTGMTWQFTEYQDDDGNPTWYYELQNEKTGDFIAPQISGGQILSDSVIGINLNGRRSGSYYSTIAAWDSQYYAYACLKADLDQMKVVTIPYVEASQYPDAVDFAFAVVKNRPVDDALETVATLDHERYGITMKIVDIGTRQEMSNFLNNDQGGTTTKLQQGLLSTNLGPDGYPTAFGGSLANLYAGEKTVNHLFIESTYRNSGYFSFDSTQNFASLQGTDFKVYKELGSYDSSGTRPTLKHGQFFPFNDIRAGHYASVNGENLYSNTAELLPDSDPRKHERLYLIDNVDCYFAVELEASFVQTPDGKDAWGHDIIYEFTGDDDFWLYVDGELIIDLGGIHSAVPGSVNYRTGEVNVNGTHTTIRDLIRANYVKRGLDPDQVDADYKFVQKPDGSYVFADGSTHTMRIFYMERGAGASNLRMRFNLASVKPGTVQLTKGLQDEGGNPIKGDSVTVEFPYQIYCRLVDREWLADDNSVTVTYKDRNTNVKFVPEITIGGVTYQNVFLLKPDETAEIDFHQQPGEDIEYRIVECGVDTTIYQPVFIDGVNQGGGQPVIGPGGSAVPDRADYPTSYARTKDRATVDYINRVRTYTLTVKKRLWSNETYPEKELFAYKQDGYDDSSTFKVRLYLGSEYDAEPTPAYMYEFHVRDLAGRYCYWSEPFHRFVPVSRGGTTFTDFSLLNDQEKSIATFNSSIYGAIEEVPAGYSIEVLNVMPGTKYRVEEREWEQPDSYELRDYVVTDETGTHTSVVPQTSAFAGHDVQIDVNNLKGYGLRVYKSWSDADFMKTRDPAYFAVYYHPKEPAGNNTWQLVNGSVREMAYSRNPDDQTLYWYYLPLPVAGATLEEFFVREVTLRPGSYSVASGVVMVNSGDVTMVDHNGSVTMHGQRTGEIPTEFNYSVRYVEDGVPIDHNRAFQIANITEGILIKKQGWNGQPLAGARFKLEKRANPEDILLGSFTSDADGLITEAFLESETQYILTELETPQAYRGLQEPMTISLDASGLNIGYPDEAYYTLTTLEGGQPVLIVKDRPYELKAVKTDEDGSPLSGAHFALHKWYSNPSSGHSGFDVNPMDGYEDLVTGSNGLIPKVNETLKPGRYQLREKTQPAGYRKLSSYIEFTVSDTGSVTLDQAADGVTLTSSEPQSSQGPLVYTLTIPNQPIGTLKITKTLESEPEGIAAPEGMTVPVTVMNAAGKYLQSASAPYVFASSAPEEPIRVPVSGGLTLPDIPADTYTVTEIPGEGGENVAVERYLYQGTDYSPAGPGGECGLISVTKANTASNPALAGITNRYVPSDASVTLKKVVSGNQGNLSEVFSFDVLVSKNEDGTQPIQIEGLTGVDGKMTAPVTRTHTMSGDDLFLAKFPVGVWVTITEKDASDYKTRAAADGTTPVITDDTPVSDLSKKICFQVTQQAENDSIVVVFHNYNNLSIPTGIRTDAAPYLILLTLAMAGLVWFIVRRRRERGEIRP